MRPKLNEGLCSPWAFQGLTLCIICIVLCRIKGAILTHDRDVELGGNATLRCTLPVVESSETVQVTWQQEVNKNFVNLAAYTNKSILNIDDRYKGRVNLTIFEHNDTAISFWNVSTQENGCYRCIFNIYPQGSKRNKACLSVYGRLNTFLHYSISDGRLNATCLATGFPRPNITWVAPRGLKEEHEITNPNGTVSVISNILVNASDSHSGQEMICKVTHRGKEMDLKVPRKGYPYAVVVTVLFLISLTVVIIAVCCWKRHQK
ncbi:OX-2 membrane glycoprotein [Zootoca vivipara]|uniref:OX-2 membrane glycoprotein n=1 Tax=Zootoca vivipara TaxID=8524 RepID=UPI0015915D0E|nr:OX-2 membrane glycoprotein [Zootoca vivipara]XP_034970668.1 OX-2 membrane glycoprotein [Zootoca vivipara]